MCSFSEVFDFTYNLCLIKHQSKVLTILSNIKFLYRTIAFVYTQVPTIVMANKNHRLGVASSVWLCIDQDTNIGIWKITQCHLFRIKQYGFTKYKISKNHNFFYPKRLTQDLPSVRSVLDLVFRGDASRFVCGI